MEPIEPAATTSKDASAQGAPSADDARRFAKRKVRNYLLDTSLQLRLASYLLAVATTLSIGLGWLLWQAYRETSRVVALGDPEMGEPIARALATEDRWRIVLVAFALGVVLVCLLGAAVVITHRIAGPAFVIGRVCRQVGEGNLSPPRPLRSHDLLTDLAEDVTDMVEALRGRDRSEREVALRVAATLRDGSATGAQRAAAAVELERMAAEKEARLRS